MKRVLHANYFSVVLLAVLVLAAAYYYDAKQPKKGAIILEVPQKVVKDQRITVPVIIDTGDQSINAAEVYIVFDPSLLEVKEVTKDQSFFQLWITDQPSFSNEKGLISFAGGLPTPGFKGKGTVGSIIAIPKRQGAVTLTFDSKSRILKNDGLGSAVPLRLRPITMVVN